MSIISSGILTKIITDSTQGALRKNPFRLPSGSEVKEGAKTVGKGLLAVAFFPLSLGGCDSPHSNNNNIVNNNNNNKPDADADVDGDAHVDGDADVVTDADADAGDGGIDKFCIPNEQRPGIVDNKKALVYDTYDCSAVDIDYNVDKFHIACAFPNNRLLTYQPGTNTLSGHGQILMSSQGPLGHDGDVHPRSIYPFESYIAVPYQTENQAYPTDVYGGVYLHDLESGVRLDTMQLSFSMTCGGCPEGDTFLLHYPVAAIYSGEKLYVTNENYNPEAGLYVRSIVPGFGLATVGVATMFDHERAPALAMPDGYRTAGAVNINDSTMAVVVSGLAASNQPAKIVLFNTTADVIMPVPITGEIDLNLAPGEELISLAEPAVVSPNGGEPTQIIVAATDGVNQKIVIASLNEAVTPRVRELDLTQYLKGRIVGLLSDGYRLYVLDSGNKDAVYPEDNTGRLIVLNIAKETGEPSFFATNGSPIIPLGVNPRAAEVDPDTGKIYVAVDRRSDCNGVEANDNQPYIMEIDPAAYFGQ